MQTNDALFKANDAPQLLVATITTNTTTAGVSHDLSNCFDQIVAVPLTVSAYSGAGSVKLLLQEIKNNLENNKNIIDKLDKINVSLNL